MKNEQPQAVERLQNWKGRRRSTNGFGSAAVVRNYIADRGVVIAKNGQQFDLRAVLNGDLDAVIAADRGAK